MAELGTYSAQATSVTWAGHVFVGLAGDDAIKIEQTEDTASLEIGIHGDATTIVSTNNSATVTIKLLQTSSTNGFLSAKNEATKAGVVISSPMVISEAGSDAGAIMLNTLIMKSADFIRGAGHNEVEWSFISGDATITHGGIVN